MQCKLLIFQEIYHSNIITKHFHLTFQSTKHITHIPVIQTLTLIVLSKNICEATYYSHFNLFRSISVFDSFGGVPCANGEFHILDNYPVCGP